MWAWFTYTRNIYGKPPDICSPVLHPPHEIIGAK